MLAGDSVIFFNFRGDRALEITEAFEAEELSKFDRAQLKQHVTASFKATRALNY